LTWVSATAATFAFTTTEGAGTDFNVCAGMSAAGAYAALTTPDTIDITAAPTCNATAATYTNGAAGTCNSTTMASGTTCQSTCDSKYTSAGTASCSAGTLTVAACIANVCTRPSTAGYIYTSEDANCLVATGTAATCSASLSCATGYTGTPVATLCTSAGAYSVTGCTEVTTTTTTTAPTANTTTAAVAAAKKDELSVATQASTSILALFGTMFALFLAHL
jgi:hypothetical protein